MSQGKQMEVAEMFDLTKSISATAQLCGVDRKTVRRTLAARSGGAKTSYSERGKVSDPFEDKITEWIERSSGKIRADVVHEKLVVMGYSGSERTTRRVVNEVKRRYQKQTHRVYKPWITEPGLWLQYDFAKGPSINGTPTTLFCAWLAWSRYRVVFPIPDRSIANVISALDRCFRLIGGVPGYVLTDNERSVSTDHIAHIAVRNPQMVSVAVYYGFTLATCVPFDPESKGGSESTVRIAKADLCPKDTNLIESYLAFDALEEACRSWMEMINSRIHTVTKRIPKDLVEIEVTMMNPVPCDPYTLAFGESRSVSWSSTIRYKGAEYSVPHRLAGEKVWVRTSGSEVIVTHVDPKDPRSQAVVACHKLVLSGGRSISDEHYPPRPARPTERPPRATNAMESSFLAIGHGAQMWLIEAAGCGVGKMRAKMADALELSYFYGTDRVDEALGLCALNQRFSQGDLVSVLERPKNQELVHLDRPGSLQSGTSLWKDFR